MSSTTFETTETRASISAIQSEESEMSMKSPT